DRLEAGTLVRDPVDAGSQWSITVPSFRVDVQREIDLIEEIARHDGYQGRPATFPALTAAQPAPDPRTLRDRLLRQVLTACGFSEAVTFAFIEAEAAAPFAAAEDAEGAEKKTAADEHGVSRIKGKDTEGAEKGGLVAIANPLSEKFAVLRPSLLPGLVDAAAHNRRRQHHDVRLFETG